MTEYDVARKCGAVPSQQIGDTAAKDVVELVIDNRR
jgi:hypothetical protein